MSLNQFYNKILLFLVVSISFGKILIPQGYSGNPEILQKNNKEKEYYGINNKGLEYIIKGPAEIKIFSKAAFPKKTTRQIKQFNFDIIVNNIKTTSSNFKKLDKKTFSISHPMHLYTYSGKDIIVIPSGEYIVKIQKNVMFGSPIVVRVSRSGRKSKNLTKEPISLVEYYEKKYTIKSINSPSLPEYYLLHDSNPLFLNKEDGLIELKLRGLHKTRTDSSNILQMLLLKNGKYHCRYHIFSTPHPSKQINEISETPSKLNKIYITSTHDDNYLLQVNKSKLLIKLDRLLR